MGSNRNMAQELAMLERMGEVVIDGVQARDRISPDGTVWLQRYYHRLFDIDIPNFLSGTTSTRKSKKLGWVLISLFMICSSLLGILYALVRRPKVLVFSIDRISDSATQGDFRLSHVYKTLSTLQLSYQECFHTLYSRDVYKKYFRRARSVWYLEGIDSLYFLYKWSIGLFARDAEHVFENLPDDEEEAAFMKKTLMKYLRMDKLYMFRLGCIQKLYKIIGYKVVIGIDDVRHYHEVHEAAKRIGILSVAVQHGHFTKYHVGWRTLGSGGPFARAEKMFVWNEYWKQELQSIGSVYGDDIVVAGGEGSKEIVFAEESGQKVILIPFETVAPNEEVGEYIAKLTQCGYRVVVKGRPDVPMHEQEKVYGVPVEVITNLKDVPKPIACVGVYSTFLYDMHAAGIPVGILETSMDYGEGMVLGGVASLVRLEGACDEVRSLTWKSDARLEDTADFTKTLHGVLEKAGVV